MADDRLVAVVLLGIAVSVLCDVEVNDVSSIVGSENRPIVNEVRLKTAGMLPTLQSRSMPNVKTQQTDDGLTLQEQTKIEQDTETQKHSPDMSIKQEQSYLEKKLEKQNSSHEQQIMKERNSAKPDIPQDPVQTIPQDQINPEQLIQKEQNPLQNSIQQVPPEKDPRLPIATPQEQNHVKLFPQPVSSGEPVQPISSGQNQVQPVSSGQNQVQPVSSEQNQVQPVSSGQNQVQPVSSGQNQVQPVSSGQNQVQPISAEQNQVQPISAEQNQVQPVSSGQNQVQPVSSGQNQVQPISAEQNQVQPVSSEQNQVQPVSSGQNQVQPVSSGQNQVQPVSSGQNQVQPISAEQNQVQPVSSEQNQVQPVSSGQNKVQPVSSGQNQVQPVSSGLNQVQPVSSEQNQVQSVSPGQNQIQPVSAEQNTEQPISAGQNQVQPISADQPALYEKGKPPAQKQTDIDINDVTQSPKGMETTTQYFTTSGLFRDGMDSTPMDNRILSTTRKPFLALQQGPVILSPGQINSIPADPSQKLFVSDTTTALTSYTTSSTSPISAWSTEEDDKDTFLKAEDNFYAGLDLWGDDDEEEFPTDDSQPLSDETDDDWNFFTGEKLIPKGKTSDISYRPSMESYGDEKDYPPPKEGLVTSSLHKKHEDINVKMDMLAYYSWILFITFLLFSIFILAKQRQKFGYIMNLGQSKRSYGRLSDAEEGKNLMKNIHT